MKLSFMDFKTAVQERKVSPFRSLSDYEKVFEKLISCCCYGIFNLPCKKPVSETQVHRIHSIEAALMLHHLR